jgi:hypothetical protein
MQANDRAELRASKVPTFVIAAHGGNPEACTATCQRWPLGPNKAAAGLGLRPTRRRLAAVSSTIRPVVGLRIRRRRSGTIGPPRRPGIISGKSGSGLHPAAWGRNSTAWAGARCGGRPRVVRGQRVEVREAAVVPAWQRHGVAQALQADAAIHGCVAIIRCPVRTGRRRRDGALLDQVPQSDGDLEVAGREASAAHGALGADARR